MKERGNFPRELGDLRYLVMVIWSIFFKGKDPILDEIGTFVRDRNKESSGDFLQEDKVVNRMKELISSGSGDNVGWNGIEVNTNRLIGYLEEFTDRFNEEKIDRNIFPPKSKVKELVDKVLKSSDKVGVVEILEFSLSLVDDENSKLLKALLLAWATTRLMARSFDRRAYPEVGLGNKNDEFNRDLTEEWWNKLIPFPNKNGEEENDRMGDYYYFFTLLIGGVVGGRVKKLIVEIGPEVMVWARKRAGVPTLTPHATAIAWARKVLSYNT